MKKGFTLIELLVVIVIIAILAAVIFVALDPITRFQQARDAQRWNAVNNILTAVHQCIVDNEGILTDCDANLSSPLAETELGTGSGVCGTACADGAGDCLDLSTSHAKYLADIPQDPSTGSGARTRYTIQIDANGIVWIRACDEEVETDIYVAR